MPSKQSQRRKLAKLRAEFYGAPWAIDVRALGAIGGAIDKGDIEAICAQLSNGSDPIAALLERSGGKLSALANSADNYESDTRVINGIAVIPVCGVLRDQVDFMVRYGDAASYQLIERDFNAAMDSQEVKGILFYFDTPGGSAIGCKRVADEIFEARGEKPVVAFVQGVCCSAGYYIASACDKIESTPDSLIGSIGTILPHQEFAGMLKEMGIGATVITNKESPVKGHGNPYEPLSDDAKKTLQRFVDSFGAPFISDVARFRGVSRDVVAESFGKGDSMRADIAIGRGMIDSLVGSFQDALQSLSGSATSAAPGNNNPPANSGTSRSESTMNKKIIAQLFALGLVDSVDTSEKECKAALNAFFHGRGISQPSAESDILLSLQQKGKSEKDNDDDGDDDDDKNDGDGEPLTKKKGKSKSQTSGRNPEQTEARLDDLQARAALLNTALGKTVISAEMVLEAHKNDKTVDAIAKEWASKLSQKESEVPGGRVDVKGEGADQYATDVVDAMIYKGAQSLKKDIALSDSAAPHVRKPLWAIAGECLQLSGAKGIDMYGDREYLAEQAMQMGNAQSRQTFFSPKEKRQYVQAASGTPVARPGDFPNILSALANKFLDTIELDQDYSYSKVSALLPGGLSDFKPAIMINKGIVEELDEVRDAEQVKELGLSEEVLSYIFLRRFANKWGWTPVLLANDDLGAFVEGMLGLDEAWQVTQNRQVVDLFTSNPTLLDGSALFANRADTGAGTNPALNNNDRSSGGAPSDSEWAAMETLYADIGGVGTGRRVRGALDTVYCPTGTQAQEARRTFLPLAVAGLEQKIATTTSAVGLYRGIVNIILESELRVSSSVKYYGMRSPTRLNTATVVRAYFNGFGEQGRRERWYDPETKTTWVSIEGRIATAIKNWRYVIRNAGA